MMWGYNYGWSMFWIILWSLISLVLLLVLIWALVRGASRTSKNDENPHYTARGLDALEILQQRYARGEIDTPTYEQMRDRIEASWGREAHA